METKGESKSVETSAKNVELAIEKGLAELGIDRDEAEITVVKPGSRGVLGIGAEDAIVRISLRPPQPTPEAPEEVAPPPAAQEPAPKPEPVQPKAEPEKPKAELVQPKAELVQPKAELVQPKAPAPEPVPPEREATTDESAPESPEDDLVAIAKEVLETLLHHMGIQARVEEAEEISKLNTDPEQVIALNVTGDDLGTLIGRRGETLRDLQFITRLIVSRRIQRWPSIVVDVEYYKARREKLLVDLARRMADRVRDSGRPRALEPMPAHERRIVHLSLRDDPDVITESTGEEQARKVVIIPRR